ncbi:DUF2497 domain-containing protein, partial [Bosea sp. (in: a-proteobacteria)]|uniref:PopZ family protein n=1 Tax=Bosea sp. (in: a-proteobacteria) TaxID=1871050 RepID=UPI00120E1CC2
MNAQAKPNEPSMEEILASIRRIISDDEAKPEEAAPAAEPEPEPAAAATAEPAPIDDDVLDLGTEAAFVAPPVMPEPEPAPQPQFESDVDFADPAPSPVVAMPAPPPPAPEPDPAPVFASNPQAIDMASLLSDQTSSAVTSAFGQLANTVLSNNARTLEDLVKDMLKPMLKGWLDDNLPGMVERLVRA